VSDTPNHRTLERPGEPHEVDDDILTGMVRDLGSDTERGEGIGADRDRRDQPFNLSLPAPRAIDLRRLWKLAGKEPDPTITAAIGARIPVLLSHGVTALPRPGRKPARVWGIGYKVEMFDVAANTIDVQPATDLVQVAKVGAEATVDIGFDGSLEVPQQARQALGVIPGVNLTAAKVSASVGESAKLSIAFALSVPRVISGAGDGQGGAEWNLYAQDKRLEGQQALLQTVLLPRGVKQLQLAVTGWVREAGFFGPKEWVFEVATFNIALER
jgi:hypothetical protein